MQVRFPVFALLLLGLAACSTEPKSPKYHPPGEHGLGWRILHPFARSEAAPAPSAAATAFQPAPQHGFGWRILHPFAKNETTPRKSGLQVTVEPDSTAPSLHAISQLGLRILVTNYTNTMVSLTFPSNQRIEITGRSVDGKIFYSYSTNRTFAQEVSVLTINPGERLEYNETVPTRSMTAGSTYLIAASVKGQPGLEGTASITPVP